MLARRVFLTHNKLIRKPGCVGKRTRSCTTWNSWIIETFPGLAGILAGKMPSDGPKHSSHLCSRDHISPSLAQFSTNTEPCRRGQRKLSDGTKNVEIRHRELGQICVRTQTKSKEKWAEDSMHFSSRQPPSRAKSF
jgi:hypothetical protein